MSPKNVYLIIYNSVLCVGWAVILMGLATEIVSSATSTSSATSDRNIFQDAYSKVEFLLKVSQTAAVLEILHCIIRFVPSSPVLTGFQVFSRLFVLWAVTIKVPTTQEGPGVLLYLACWSITEVIRYAYYVCNIVGFVPYVLLWCRYTFFFFLYPLGVTGELMTIYKSLPYVKDTRIYSYEMPNAINFSFSYYYFLHFVMLCYIPIFPQLYFHMVAQRKKFIGSKAKKTV